MGLERLELSTSRLSGVRSNQLSYRPSFPLKVHSLHLDIQKSATEETHFLAVLALSLRFNSLELLRLFLRKEVIQPHLPVQLPCYDFVPVTSPTLGSCLLTVSAPTSGVTSSHDVTGGVYKARERIQRRIADRRLLATPTSWRRVAASNPN